MVGREYVPNSLFPDSYFRVEFAHPPISTPRRIQLVLHENPTFAGRALGPPRTAELENNFLAEPHIPIAGFVISHDSFFANQMQPLGCQHDNTSGGGGLSQNHHCTHYRILF